MTQEQPVSNSNCSITSTSCHLLNHRCSFQISRAYYITAGKPQALEFRTPFFLIWSLPRSWYGSLSGSISLNHLSIFYNISCYNSLVLLTFVSRFSCRITYVYISNTVAGPRNKTSLISSTSKTDRHDMTEILLKLALNTIIITLTP